VVVGGIGSREVGLLSVVVQSWRWSPNRQPFAVRRPPPKRRPPRSQARSTRSRLFFSALRFRTFQGEWTPAQLAVVQTGLHFCLAFLRSLLITLCWVTVAARSLTTQGARLRVYKRFFLQTLGNRRCSKNQSRRYQSQDPAQHLCGLTRRIFRQQR